MWRRYFNGVPSTAPSDGSQGSSGILIRYSLEESARKVGLSKKSLDDYLL